MDILGLGLIQINNWLLLFVTIIVSVYIYYTWNFDYWTSRGINGPKPTPLVGNMGPLMSKGFHVVIKEWSKQYGLTLGMFEGRKPVLVTQDPEMLKQLFVKQHHDFPNRRVFKGDETMDRMMSNATGEVWKILRTVMSPTFSTGKLKVMTKQINECAQELVDNLQSSAETGEAVELKDLAGCFTMDVIATTAFGIKVGSQKDKDNEFVRMGKKSFDFSLFSPFFLIVMFCPSLLPILAKFKISFFPKDVINFFTNATNQAIDARKESGETRLDFMQLMMNAHKEVKQEDKEDDKDDDKEENDALKGVTKRSLTRDEVVAQGILFFIAGYETTASSIAFLLYNLALNPDIQEKLHEEIMDVAGDKEINHSMVQQMTLLDMCSLESLRIYPPAQATDRICERDTKLNGIDIFKGQQVSVPIYAIHHNPEIWPEPEKFDPYRFTPEEKGKHGPYDWIPFGAGPRNCLAMRLALVELKLAVAYVVRKYKVMRCDKTEVPIVLKTLGLTAAKNGIFVQVQNRS